MKFKLYILFIPLFLCCLSCGKEEPVAEQHRVDVAMSLSDEFFRLYGEAGPEDAGTVDVLLFRDNGMLQSYSRLDIWGGRVSVVKDMPFDYRVVTDAPAGLLEDVATERQFASKVIRLEDNAGPLVMGGSGREVFSRSGSLAVDVRRYLSRVILHDIRPEFMTGAGEGGAASVRIVRAWMRNVPEGVHADFSPYTEGRFYNVSGVEDLPEALRPLLVKDLGITLEDASPVGVDLTLLCCANPVACLADDVPQKGTSLMLDLDAVMTDGSHRVYTYCVRLLAIEPNTEYVVNNLILKTAPFDPAPVQDALSYTISVHPWGESRHDVELD